MSGPAPYSAPRFSTSALRAVLISPRADLVREMPGDSDTIVLDIARRRVVRGGTVETLSLKRFRYVSALACARGGLVPHEAIFDAVWGDDPDGGPEDINLCHQMLRFNARQQLRRLGLTIRAHFWADSLARTRFGAGEGAATPCASAPETHVDLAPAPQRAPGRLSLRAV